MDSIIIKSILNIINYIIIGLNTKEILIVLINIISEGFG